MSAGNLRHSSDTPAAQARILVAVSPTINRSLDQSSLSAQRRVQLREGPTNRIALGFVDQPIPPVLFFAATSSGIDTVLSLEILRQTLHIHGFHVTPDGIPHLHAVPRIFESDPLHPIGILMNH